MKKIYLIPGLGADESVFKDYRFLGFERVILSWLEPRKSELLKDYAVRIFSHITVNNPIIVGVSFGGMVAVEIANILPESQLILISSVSEYKDISSIKRLVARSGLINNIPDRFLTTPNRLLFWLFGVKEAKYRDKLSMIISNTSPSFLKWAIGAIGSWKGRLERQEYLQIHGSQDRILPLKRKVDYIVRNGGHFMVVERAEEVETFIAEWLKYNSSR